MIGMSAHSYMRARVCLSMCSLFMHYVCGLYFCLYFVCVPPFSKEGGDVVYKCGGFKGSGIILVSDPFVTIRQYLRPRKTLISKICNIFFF